MKKILFLLPVVSALLSAAPDSALAEKHLLDCGLSEASKFSESSAWLSEAVPGFHGINMEDAVTEQRIIDGIRQWATTQPMRVRIAYMDALQAHQEGVSEAISEFKTHKKLKYMQEYEQRHKNDEAESVAHMSEMPSPCHSSPTPRPRK